MPKTVAPPPTDPRLWRQLLKRVHPDHGGSESLFVWVRALQERVCGQVLEDPPPRSSTPRQKPPRSTAKKEEPARVPFDEDAQDFDDLTDRAVALAATVDAPYGRLLRLLEDIEEEDHLHAQQQLGATYKTLAAIGYAAGMDGAERAEWYKLAEQVPLSQRHAGHILTELKKGET